MQGNKPQAIVASELIAMFSADVLPTLRAYYYDGGNEDSYEKQCKEFAAKVGLPQEQWALITLPCFLSLDWDHRHVTLRQTLSLPRVSSDELLHVEKQAYKELLGFEIDEKELPSQPAGASHELGEYIQSKVNNTPTTKDALQAALVKYKCDHNVEALTYYHWKLSLTRQEFCTVIPHQYMPLCPITPDIHSIVEHMVGTLKGWVRRKFLAMDLDSDEVLLGSTYQGLIRKAVQERGNGQAGREHIQGSLRKWVHILDILSAEKGQELKIPYDFSNGKMSGQQEHCVQGTAGDWPPHKWT